MQSIFDEFKHLYNKHSLDQSQHDIYLDETDSDDEVNHGNVLQKSQLDVMSNDSGAPASNLSTIVANSFAAKTFHPLSFNAFVTQMQM